jgi:ferric-dicitrate binding protein FerR (iron transport regulator)
VASGFFPLKSVSAGSSIDQTNLVRTITTQHDQHRLVTLSDGTQIRLNSNSTIKVPNSFSNENRTVTLDGEAWFGVASDEDRPFYIQAGQATIQVLGTEFNVKMDDIAGNVQVAVAEGRVSLNNTNRENESSAILTKNTYAVYNIDSREILIEQTPVENYMSWISGKLFFYNEPLWVVSRYIERLYGVNFQFEQESLKELSLSTNMARESLPDVLDIIAQTLGIGYTLENNTVTWNRNVNPKTPK